MAYTINRSRDEEWFNHYSTTQNLEATAIDDVTLEVTTSVPDPKLPTLDVYIVPQHIYEDISADDIGTYEATDGVASGPYSLTELRRGQDWTMEANPNYWAGEPAVDRVIFRLFTNPDAMVTALEQGEIDAAHNIPSASVANLDGAEGIVVVQGQQGGFDEVAMNAGAGGIGDGHPALEDVAVRQAIAHAVDKETIVDRVLNGLGEPADAMSVSPDRSWTPEIEDPFEFDLDVANQILDDAGYEDTDGNGVREMPGGGRGAELPLGGAHRVRGGPAHLRAGERLAGRDRHRDRGRDLQRHPARPGRSAGASGTCSSGAGRPSSTRIRSCRTSSATRSRPTPRTR